MRSFYRKMAIVYLAAAIIFGSSPNEASAAERVKVINGPKRPIPIYKVDASEKVYLNFSIPFDETQGVNFQTFTVPADKVLVIENFSGTIGLQHGDVVDLGIQAVLDGTKGTVRCVPTAVGAAWGYPKSYLFNQNTKIYADSNTSVTIYVTNNLTGGGGAVGTIVGRYLPINFQ